MNPLKKLNDFGQSVYMDEIKRSMMHDGYLKTLIERDGLRGVTSNPAIFEKAIAQSNEYDSAIADLAAQGKSTAEIYEDIVIQDIQDAADLFRDLYDANEGRYGYVSLEVAPDLANDTEGTVKEARHLWQRLGRPNTFIKVPGTSAGLPAITTLISEGINVNVTLLFGLERYRDVAWAYVEGLEKAAASGKDISRIASVASFFLSRIDVMLDPMFDELAAKGNATAKNLKGKVAIANAKLAYQIYKDVFGSDRWQALANQGARVQRLLWASTGTKNPDYSDVMYVEPLVGQDTVNTMPTSTLDAYRDHGNPADLIEDSVDEAKQVLAEVARLGINMDEITQTLEDEGVDKFIKPFNSLMKTLDEARSKAPA
ncbi:MAG: transaldolase [Trueperaceae bacterium]|nr:transaldolase [Trueperaceae bacterium]